MAFLDYLVQKGVIALSEVETVLELVAKSSGDLIEVLGEQGVDKDNLLKLKSEYFNMPVRTIKKEDIPLDILKYIPEESALHYQFVPIKFADDILEVGMVDPDNLEARDALQFISARLNIPFKLFLISKADFTALIESYKSLTGEVHKALSDLQSELKESPEVSPAGRAKEAVDISADVATLPEDAEGGDMDPATKKVVKISKKEAEEMLSPEARKKKEKKDLEAKIVADTPITKIVAVLLRHAVEGGASDVHIEPTPKKTKVRFRVDGALYTSLFLPSSVHNSVVARIKVLTNLKLDEKRKPQDGSFSARIEKRKIDFRVSTFPTYYGEKVVLRILDPGKGVKSLEQAGLGGRNLKKVREALKKPFGLILITGPTGSGKTTTLYAMLNEVDRETQNVVSLEDPVEYNIEGISQSQVRPEIGYTFSTGLRSILRQDPDVIMVGEIRDKETAQLAIQAALTGHLVFSTLHTNNAAGVIPRLVDMGVDPYLIAPTLIAAIGQRLVPTICPTSKNPLPIEGSIKKMIEKQFSDIPENLKKEIPQATEVYDAKPSPECPGGTRGRIGVFEVMTIGKEMEKVILENPVESEILKAARAKGMFSMKDDALFKSFEGIVPFHEVNKFE